MRTESHHGSERSTATHEAAHLVLYNRAGIDTGDVTIDPGDGERLGVCEAGDWWNQQELEGAVVALLGGRAAEIELCGSDPAAKEHGAWSDFDEAESLIERFKLDGDMDSWMARARQAVKREEKTIRAVADALLALRRIDMADATWILDDLDGGEEVADIISAIREYRHNFGIEGEER